MLCDLVPQVKHCNAVTRAQAASEMRALPFAEAELVLDVESRPERRILSRQTEVKRDSWSEGARVATARDYIGH